MNTYAIHINEVHININVGNFY